MLLTVLGAIAALLVGLIAGAFLAGLMAISVWTAVSVAANTREPEFAEIYFRRLWPAIPMTAILAVAVVVTPGAFAAGLAIGFGVILAFQVGRAYQYYSYN